MIVVLDASPLIFLGKLGRLALIVPLLGKKLHLAASVRDEVLEPFAGSVPEALGKFLEACMIHPVRARTKPAGSLSRPDADTLALAVKLSAEIMLADDRVLRRSAEMEGIRPLGTLGVLLRSVASGHLSTAEARADLDALVAEHHFRIGVEVYRAALAKLT